MGPNQLEVEVKIRCEGNPLVSSPEMQTEEIVHRHFEDNWLLDLQDRRLTSEGLMLRVRRAHGKGVLTWKGPAREHRLLKIRQEIEVEVPDPQNLLEILNAIGFRTIFRYQKFRTIFSVRLPGNTTLHAMYDETPIGRFLELEGEESAIAAALALMGIPTDRTTRDSYAGLYHAHCQERQIPFGDMIFESMAAPAGE